MKYIDLKSYAKINLALDVLNKRNDGYHNVRMIMQTISLHDNIFIKKIPKNKIEIRSNVSWLPTDSKNLAYKAAQLMIKNYNINEGISIDINKNIPISAGLAGGSSNCATVLLGVKKLFKLNISAKELLKMGKTLGADVPYCIIGGTALAEGIGDKITRLTPHPKVYVLIAKPNINVSTKFVYDNLDLKKITKRPDIDSMINYINNSNLDYISSNFCNVLENVTETEYPIIKKIKMIMLMNNALGALMSGSGPTVFGYFRTKKECYKASLEIKYKLSEVREIYLTGIFNPRRSGKFGK